MSSPTPTPTYRRLEDLQDLWRSSFHSQYRRKLADKGVSPQASFPKKLAVLLDSDVGPWISTYLKYVFQPRHAFQDYRDGSDDGVYELRGDSAGGPVRVAMAGDWGSGTKESERVAAGMANFAAHYTIHLGDVYYVGDADEVRENFLGLAPPNIRAVRWPGGSHGSFALNGNHEMYANGTAYFDLMLPALGTTRAAVGGSRPQRASFFCLKNDAWLVIGLDTGYNSIGWPIVSKIPVVNRIPAVGGDCRLEAALCDWLRTTVAPYIKGRGIVLLSHHQYYSAFDDEYPILGQQLAEFFKEPVLWFWGHEHRLVVYDCFHLADGIRAFGRCVGHGGMPVSLDDPTRGDRPLVWSDRRPYTRLDTQAVGYNGYVTLVFERDALSVEYVDIEGAVLRRERWRSTDGHLATV